MEPQSVAHFCEATFQSLLQNFVLLSLPAVALAKLRATCTLLQNKIDGDSPCVWAGASSGDACFQAKGAVFPGIAEQMQDSRFSALQLHNIAGPVRCTPPWSMFK